MLTRKFDRSLSSLELYWENAPIGSSILPFRGIEYDSENQLFYQPIKYKSETIHSTIQNAPSEDWVEEVFNERVLGSPDAERVEKVCPEKKVNYDQKQITDEILFKYEEQCVQDLVYSGLIEGLIHDKKASLAEKIHSLLCHDVIGNPANKGNLNIENIEFIIEQARERKLPLQFFVPSFPFKDQNPYRTDAPAYHVDLGEIALLIRLHTLALAIYQIYPFGAEWVVLTDGIAYSRAFGVDPTKAEQYRETLRYYRNRLNLSNTVNIIDLNDVATRLGTFCYSFDDTNINENANFNTVNDHVFQILQDFSRTNKIEEKMQVLIRGMKWNINLKNHVNNGNWELIWRIINGESREAIIGEEPFHSVLYDDIANLSKEAALKWASFNITAKHLKLIEQIFPHSIRATIHSKKDQVAIPLNGKPPWNSVPVLKRNLSGMIQIETMPFFEVLDFKKYSINYLYDGKYPLFYEQLE